VAKKNTIKVSFSIRLAAVQVGGGTRINATIDGYSHETHEKTQNNLFLILTI
jgi:hypothetical protein